MAKRNIYPTAHAVEKMNSRNVKWGDILDTIDHPEVTYGPDDRGRIVYQRLDLGVVVGKDDAVITVLLRQEDDWVDDDVRGRERTR